MICEHTQIYIQMKYTVFFACSSNSDLSERIVLHEISLASVCQVYWLVSY